MTASFCTVSWRRAAHIRRLGGEQLVSDGERARLLEHRRRAACDGLEAMFGSALGGGDERVAHDRLLAACKAVRQCKSA
eukprot:7200799-Prymnesium_polylepis.1